MKLFRRSFLVVGILAFPLLPALCRAADPIPKIGMLLPLTGNYAAVGSDNRQGIEVALDFAQARNRVEAAFADSKAEAVTAISEFRKLIETEQVVAVFAMRGPVGMAVNPISRELGIGLVGGVGNKDFTLGNPYAIQAWPDSEREGQFLANTFSDLGTKRVAIITSQDDWPVAVTKALLSELEAKNISITSRQEVLPSETDLRSYVSQMKRSSPEIIFANLSLTQIAPFLKFAREQRLSVPIYSNFWAAKSEVIDAAGKDVTEGVRFVEMDTNLPFFRAALDAKFHSEPSGATLSAYAATLLLTQPIFKDVKNSKDFASALLKETEVRTPDGPIPIQDRKIRFPLVIRVIENGKAVNAIKNPSRAGNAKEGLN